MFLITISDCWEIETDWLGALSDDASFGGLRKGSGKFHKQRLLSLALRYYIISVSFGLPPRDIRFEYSEKGKPRLASPALAHPIHFSQSHTDDFVLLALSDMPCGVDIEKMRNPKKYPHIVAKGLPADWTRALSSIQDHSAEGTRRFTAYWTALESYHKIQGSVSLRQFLRNVSGTEATLHDDATLSNYCGYHFDVDQENIACLTVAREASRIRFFQVPVRLIISNLMISRGCE